jgi:hypothetical protein
MDNYATDLIENKIEELELEKKINQNKIDLGYGEAISKEQNIKEIDKELENFRAALTVLSI